MTNSYKNAYKEVYTILNYLDEEDYERIPPEVVEAIKSNMNEEYQYEINEDVDIFKQQRLLETKATLYNVLNKMITRNLNNLHKKINYFFQKFIDKFNTIIDNYNIIERIEKIRI